MAYEVDTTGSIPTWSRADRIRKARDSADMSQQELADAIGVSLKSVKRWERGGNVQDWERVLVRIAEATGVDRAWLAGFRTGNRSLEVVAETFGQIDLALDATPWHPVAVTG